MLDLGGSEGYGDYWVVIFMFTCFVYVFRHEGEDGGSALLFSFSVCLFIVTVSPFLKQII